MFQYSPQPMHSYCWSKQALYWQVPALAYQKPPEAVQLSLATSEQQPLQPLLV
jgi:hypothetical protein